MTNIWDILSIEPTVDSTTIKKAYRKALPKYHPETDPEGFKRLREAYEQALAECDLSATVDAESSSTSVDIHPTIQNLHQLMHDPQRRFTISEWQDWIQRDVNELSLEEFEKIQFWVLQELINEQNYLSYPCARLVTERFNWQNYYEQHGDLQSQQIVLAFIQLCQADNLFDYALLIDYPRIIQDKIIEFYQTCNDQSRSTALHYLHHSLSIHHALPIPNDPKLIIKIAQWHMLIDAPSLVWFNALLECRSNTQDSMILKDIDYLMNFHRMAIDDQYIQLLTDLNPHFHISIAFQSYLENSNFFPFIYIAHFFKHHVVKNLTEHHQFNFQPVLSISLPLSVITYKTLREDVVTMIKDYWHDDAFDFQSVSLIDKPNDPIQALLYSVWVIKYGDEWSLEAFIHCDYQYDEPIVDALLKNFQAIAQDLLNYFQSSALIHKAKSILKIYDAPSNHHLQPWTNTDDLHIIHTWMNRFHPFTCEPFQALAPYQCMISSQSIAMREYFAYLFALSKSDLSYLIPNQSTHATWRQYNILLFLFTRTKNLTYAHQHQSLINQLPKTQLPWFDRAFQLLKSVANHKLCYQADFFWEEIIEHRLAKQSPYANIFYVYHFNWQYIAQHLSPKKHIEFFYVYLMTNLADHPDRTMSDADLLLATSMLLSKQLPQAQKNTLQQYIEDACTRSVDYKNTLNDYNFIANTGTIPQSCEEWIEPYTAILQLQHKVHINQPFSLQDFKLLRSLIHTTDYPTTVSMIGYVLPSASPTTILRTLLKPIVFLYQKFIQSRHRTAIFIITFIIIAQLLNLFFNDKSPLSTAPSKITKDNVKAGQQITSPPFLGQRDPMNQTIIRTSAWLKIPALDMKGDPIYLVVPIDSENELRYIKTTDRLEIISINKNLHFLYRNGQRYKSLPMIHYTLP